MDDGAQKLQVCTLMAHPDPVDRRPQGCSRRWNFDRTVGRPIRRLRPALLSDAIRRGPRRHRHASKLVD